MHVHARGRGQHLPDPGWNLSPAGGSSERQDGSLPNSRCLSAEFEKAATLSCPRLCFGFAQQLIITRRVLDRAYAWQCSTWSPVTLPGGLHASLVQSLSEHVTIMETSDVGQRSGELSPGTSSD